MIGTIRLAAIGGAALLLGACAGSLQTARDTAPAGSAFDQALHAGYVQLAESEWHEGDLGDTGAFAERAIASTKGRVLPEALSARSLPAGAVDDLTAARGSLMAALDAGARDRIADQAARAQVMFDCWMQEQEENNQPPDIARCRGGFEDAMARVAAAMKPPEEPQPVVQKAPEPEPKPAPVQAVPANATFVVYFDLDSTELSDHALEVITKAVKTAREIGDAKVVVTGHTDTSGSSSYNEALAERRAQAVAARLMTRGIPADAIRIGSSGERQPVFRTGDGVKEAGNRRAYIDVGR